MQENRSFDHYFGWHPDADAKNAGLTYPDDQRQPAPDAPARPRLPGLRVQGPRPRVGRRPARVQRRQARRLLQGERRVRHRLLRQGGPALHPVAWPTHSRSTTATSARCSVRPGRTATTMHSAQSGGNKSNDTMLDRPAIRGRTLQWQTIWDPMMRRRAQRRLLLQRHPVHRRLRRRATCPSSSRSPSTTPTPRPGIFPTSPSSIRCSSTAAGRRALRRRASRMATSGSARRSCRDVVNAFVASPKFRRGAMFVNYDEWGGFFDHVEPGSFPTTARARISRRASA